MAFGRVTALQADVLFQANRGQFNVDMTAIREVAERTYGGISDATLRAAVAQEKYDRTLATSKAGSFQAAKATVAYRQELAAIAAAADRAALAVVREQAAADRAASAAVAAAAAQSRRTLAAAETVGRGLTTYVTAPLALIGFAAAKMAVGFSQQMLLIQTQAGASAAEVKNLTGSVLELARTAPQSPVELAQGLYHLESLGLRGAQAMNTLKISSIAAGMGIANLEDVTTALGGVVVTGIKGAENYQRAMDTLTATVGAGNVRFEDLAGAVGNVAPAAAAAGVTLSELGAAFAVLTDRGFSADEAATKLRMTFALMQNPSLKAKKALADMGVSAESLGATLRGPNGLMNVLQTLHDGIARVGQTRGNRDLLAAFGGGRSGLGIQTLVGSLDSQLSSYQGKLIQVGADEKTASANRQAYLQSDAYKLHAALSSVQADLIKFGGGIAPVVTAVAGGFSTIADALQSIPADAKIPLDILVGILGVGGPLLLGIVGVKKAIDTIGNAFAKVPVKAAPAIAETEAELASLRTEAIVTAGSLEAIGPAALAGGTVAAGELAAVEGAAVTATATVSALQLSLLALGGLVIAPIVITILENIQRSYKDFSTTDQSGPAAGTSPGGFTNDGMARIGRNVFVDKQGRYYEQKFIGRGVDLIPITKKQAAALGASAATQKQFTGSGPQPVRGIDTPSRFAPPSLPTSAVPADSLTQLEKIQLAVSDAQTAYLRSGKEGKTALVAALKDEIDFDRKWEEKQRDLISRGVGDVGKHAKALEQLQSDEQSALQQITSIANDSAAALKKANDAIAKARAARIKLLTEIPIDDRLAEVKAEAHGASESKLLAIYRRQKKDLEAQLAELKKLHANKDDQLAIWTNIDSVQQKIDAITGKQTDSSRAQMREFLTEFASVVGQYAPNYLTPAQKPSVTVNQHFPSAPSTDYHRESRLARIATQAAMDS